MTHQELMARVAEGCARATVAAGLRAPVEQSIAHLANAWSLRRWPGAAVPGLGRPPSRWGAGLLGPLAAPGPHLNGVMDLQ